MGSANTLRIDMTTLPIRLRQGIRDLVDSPSSPLAMKFSSLTTTIGYPIIFDPEWHMLWETLKSHYTDQATFIPQITGVVEGWCDALAIWLESPDAQGDVERVLEKMNGRVRISLETNEECSRPRTKWDAERGVFILSLPTGELVPAMTAQRGFAEDLRNICRTLSSDPDSDTWAFLTSEQTVTTDSKKPAIPFNVSTALPDISSIPRPEDLTKNPPYWLLIRKEAPNRVVIEASHGPTLGVIEGYLKKWCKGNVHRVDLPLLVRIKLQESLFGLGLLHDSLVLETIRGGDTVNITLLLVLIESVLGYTPVGGGEGWNISSAEWRFRRTIDIS